MKNTTGFNRLGEEKGQYLRQHAKNPVFWWPYGPEAIQRAIDEDKPIFLSVGYSSCHWCHVMANESFEDQEIADFLNNNFISIKVDREEHPDIDQYYQISSQLYSGNGGWPLSAFLTSDMKPFFAGTYFPKETPKEGTNFLGLLKELKRAYEEDKEAVLKNANEVTEKIKNGFRSDEKIEFEGHFPAPSSIIEALKNYQDNEFGGYGEEPKFPNFPYYQWAIEHILEGVISKDQGDHIIKTMEAMLLGGLSDHARGGIHRYSTDKDWTVPHFEKMLYDQAGLLSVLSKMSLIYPSPLVYDGLFNTLEYLKQEMKSDENYFFSAQDSDSEGHEGLFFTFTKDEFIDALLNFERDTKIELTKDQDKILKWFGITENGNFGHKLNVIKLDPQFKQEYYNEEGWTLIREVRKAILNSRRDRIPPMTDTKGVASWNFILLSSLIDIVQYCQIDAIKTMASELFKETFEGMYQNFLTSRKDEKVSIRHTTTRENSLPYLEDYVFFAELQIRVYEITGNNTFKDNFTQAIDFLAKEYIDEEGMLLTRAKSTNENELYQNIAYPTFDSSFKSAGATLLGLVRKAVLLTGDQDVKTPFLKVFENYKNESLSKDPLHHGETLRSLTYPDEAYKIIKAPKSWINEKDFTNLMTFFMPRFTFLYEEKEDQRWELCNMEQTELAGVGLEEFLKALRPNQEEMDN